MAEDKETRAGLISGLLAVIMVVALSVMALTALGGGGQQFAMGGDRSDRPAAMTSSY